MYEDFKADGWNVNRPSEIEKEKYSANPQSLWVHKIEEIYSKIILFRLNHQQYDKAKRNVDRLMEIAKKRNWKYNGKTTLYLALELHRLVYAGIPDSEKDLAVEAKYEKLWQEEKANYDAWVKAAPARQAAAEKAMKEMQLEAEYQEAKRQLRAEKEAKLRRQYESQMQSLDDRERTLNALLDNNTYTNEENYLAGNLGTQEYSRRKFLRDEKADKYRKEYEDALSALDDEDE